MAQVFATATVCVTQTQTYNTAVATQSLTTQSRPCWSAPTIWKIMEKRVKQTSYLCACTKRTKLLVVRLSEKTFKMESMVHKNDVMVATSGLKGTQVDFDKDEERENSKRELICLWISQWSAYFTQNLQDKKHRTSRFGFTHSDRHWVALYRHQMFTLKWIQNRRQEPIPWWAWTITTIN